MSVEVREDARDFETQTERLKHIALAILGDEARADDVLQEVWLMTQECKPRDFANERAWLAGVVRNMARNVLRSERRVQRRERAVARAERLESTSEVVARRSVVEHLHRALGLLPRLEREALELRYLQGLELRQVAARLDRPVATVKHQVQRGLQGLRRSMRDEFGDTRAWSLGLIAAFDWEPAEVRAALGGAGLSSAFLWIGLGLGAALLTTLGVVWGLDAAGPPAGAHVGPESLAAASAPEIGPDVERAPLGRSAALPRAPLPSAGPRTQRGGAVDADALPVEPPFALAVRVVDAAGTAVPGAALFALQPAGREVLRAQTDGAGRARLEPEPGDLRETAALGAHVTLLAQAAGFARSERYSIGVGAGETRELTIELPGGEVVLEGRALDARGAPIPDALVGLLPRTQRSERWADEVLVTPSAPAAQSVDASGHFRFAHLRAGVYEAYVRDPRAGMDRETLELLEPGVHVRDLVQADGLVLRGRVVDAAGEPASSAEVWFDFALDASYATPQGNSTGTDAQGQFALPAFSRVLTRLHARTPAEAELQSLTWIYPSPEANPAYELVLGRPRPVAIEIVDRDGAGTPNLDVELVLISGGVAIPVAQGLTDAAGRVRLELGRPTFEGGLRVAVRDRRRSAVLPELEHALVGWQGEDVRLVFDPAPPGALQGHLSAAGWELPPGISLDVISTGIARVANFALPEGGGPFSLGPLPAGEVALALRGPRALDRYLERVEVPVGTSFDLGALVVPAPGSVLFDWRSDTTADAAPLAGLQLSSAAGRLVWLSSELLTEPLELWPGGYVLEVRRLDGSFSTWPFAIDAGAERWVVVDL